MAHAENTPSDRPPGDGSRPSQRSRLAIVLGIFLAVVVVVLLVWLVIYVIAS